MNANDFEALVAGANPRASTRYATGFLSPIMRSSGHILYALACISNVPALMTAEEAQSELSEAAAHLAATITVDTNCLSAAATVRIQQFKTNVEVARDSFLAWDEPARIRCLNALALSFTSLTAFLDRELLGIIPGQSDPGLAL